MKKLLGFIKKEFYHIMRDPRTLIVVFGIPVVQILLFGYVITNEIKDVSIAVFDQSNDVRSHDLITKLSSSGYFIVEDNIHSYSEINETFKKGKVKEVIVFEPNFGRNLERNNKSSIRLIADASDPNTANMIVNYTKGIVADYVNKINGGQQLPIQIETRGRMMYNPAMKGVYMFIPGIMTLILMLVSAMISSISLAREKEIGTMEILVSSPLNPVQIIIGKLAPYFLLSIINAGLIISLGIFVFNVPVVGSLFLLMMECVLFILVALSLGILISTVAKTQQVAMFMSQFALMLPTIILSGFVYPIENMPLPLRIISNVMPAKWFIIILKDVMLKGAGFGFIWKETLVLVFMLFFFVLLSIRKFKIRLE
jgi:ABC-2 type transport system permease protein